MKASNRLVFALAISVSLLQGCAGNGDTRADNPQPASIPAQAAAPANAAPATPAAAIPEDNGKPVVKADSKENFEAVVAAIHQQMQPGGRWQYISQSERSTMDGSFADMDKLYDQFGSVDKMDNAAKVRLLEDQSTVNAILTRKDGDRLICTSEMPVGSHLAVKKCRSYAEIQAEQNGAQEFLRTRAPQTQQISGH
ncbi:MAG TPA: hypothetical protein VGK80_13540 [Rhodanobacteraceae bacterium]